MPIREDELRRWFSAGDLIVLDGALGTELERRGVPTPAPRWSAAALQSHPDVVGEIHRGYVAAGARLLTANTFRVNPVALGGAVREGPALAAAAVELARRAAEHAAGARCLVAASVGPLADCYLPERVPDEATLRRAHAEAAGWLAGAQPDLAWIETINTIREARAVCEAVRSVGLPLAISFVTGEDGALLSGEPLAEAVAAVEPFDPLAIGLNCGPPSGLGVTLRRLRTLTDRPLAVYGHINNLRALPGWSLVEHSSPAAYAIQAESWVAAGATIVGGCCGTTPAHIAAVAGRMG